MLLDKLEGEGGIESVTGPRNGEDGGEGSGGVDTEGSKGTFWSLETVESVVDDDGDVSSIGARCGMWCDPRSRSGQVLVLRHYRTPGLILSPHVHITIRIPDTLDISLDLRFHEGGWVAKNPPLGRALGQKY